MRNLDFSSLSALLSTVLALVVITLIGVGVRLLAMQTIQQRRERENRQINERLRTLIAAYKTLGGSFTGDLAVDPTHRRELREGFDRAAGSGAQPAGAQAPSPERTSSDRARRMRDAVEAALSDVILLGTEEQVRLAAIAAAELASGRSVHTHELVVSLRDFIRQVLDLDAVPAGLSIPKQGPARPGAAGRSKGDGSSAKDEAKQGGKSAGAGAGRGLGAGMGAGFAADDQHEHDH